MAQTTRALIKKTKENKWTKNSDMPDESTNYKVLFKNISIRTEKKRTLVHHQNCDLIILS